MRVSFIADFGSKNRPYSGGYQFALRLLLILRSLDINLTVFSIANLKIDKDESYVSGSEIKKINIPDGGFGNPFVGLSLVKQLKNNLESMPRQDLYIFDQPMLLIDKLPIASTVAMFHGDDYVRFDSLPWSHPRALIYDLFWRKLFLNNIHRKLLNKKIGIPLFNSKDTLKLLSEDFEIKPEPLEKYVTYLPVDTDSFKRDGIVRKQVREKLNIADDEIVILALSNFDSIKAPERLKPIISNIINSEQSKKIKFLLIGGGREREVVDSIMSDKELVKYCIRIGEVPHDEVNKYYNVADIGISTSKRESFGYFIAEGMASALPFVAYSGGAIDEIIEQEKCGFCCSDLDEFTTRLRLLINDTKLRALMGERSRERIVNIFSVQQFKNKFLNILLNEFKINL